MKFKIDLHTHSILSHDGGISLDGYKNILDKKLLHYIAITDHNEINFALKAREKLGSKIIVGEEIRTSEGEIIGLFINNHIKKDQGLEKTVNEIKYQGGIVYIPHPFDYKRHCIGKKGLLKITESVDIIEVFNARSIIPNTNKLAKRFAIKNNYACAASSDAHSINEVGRTYSLISGKPNKGNIIKLFQDTKTNTELVGVTGFFNPKLNKLKKFLKSNHGNYN